MYFHPSFKTKHFVKKHFHGANMMQDSTFHTIFGTITTRNPCWSREANYHCYISYKPSKVCHTFKVLHILCQSQNVTTTMIYIWLVTNVCSSYLKTSNPSFFTTTTSQPNFLHNSKLLWLHPSRICLTCAYTTNNQKMRFITYTRCLQQYSTCHRGHKYAYIEVHYQRRGKINAMFKSL